MLDSPSSSIGWSKYIYVYLYIDFWKLNKYNKKTFHGQWSSKGSFSHLRERRLGSNLWLLQCERQVVITVCLKQHFLNSVTKFDGPDRVPFIFSILFWDDEIVGVVEKKKNKKQKKKKENTELMKRVLSPFELTLF